MLLPDVGHGYMFTLVDPGLSFDKSWKLWITVLTIIIATQKRTEYRLFSTIYF